jgi:hypothetical protein
MGRDRDHPGPPEFDVEESSGRHPGDGLHHFDVPFSGRFQGQQIVAVDEDCFAIKA